MKLKSLTNSSPIYHQERTMPLINEEHTPQHQVLINQSILKQIQCDVKELKEDINQIKYLVEFIKKYTENKKEREDNRWFR